MMFKESTLVAVVVVGMTSIAAKADPCTAELPRTGTTFAGQVRYVGDGDSICVGPTSDPNSWVEVRIADFYAPELNSVGGREAKNTLERIALGKLAQCVAGRRSYDRIVARCNIRGNSVGSLMRQAGISEGGRGRRSGQ